MDDLLTTAVDLVVREMDPERIYLFGSRARDDAREDSDLDLLVVAGDGFGARRPRWSELLRLRRALSPLRVPKDILIYSLEEMERFGHSPNHVAGRCLREGRLLYDKRH